MLSCPRARYCFAPSFLYQVESKIDLYSQENNGSNRTLNLSMNQAFLRSVAQCLLNDMKAFEGAP